MEKTRSKLLSINPHNKEKMLAVSRKMDGLILEYYRAKYCSGRAGKAENVEISGERHAAAGKL